MPPEDFSFPLSDDAFGTVHFTSVRGVVVEFVVKLYFVYENNEYELIRYDTAHGGVHKDVLFPDGSKYDVVPYYYLNNKEGLNFAIQDIRLH
jgi:hypothetical protein